MKKNQVITLEIVGTTAEGMGVGRFEGAAVFVAGAVKGDKINCKIVKVLKSYSFGIIDELITPSKDRQKPDCPAFEKCGGCVFRNISYSAELNIKQERVRDALERIGGFKDIKINPICGDSGRRRYRNKAQLPIGEDQNGSLTMGFYAPHSHRIIDIEDCLLQPKEFTAAMKVLKRWHAVYKVSLYNESTHKGLLHHLYLRIAEKTGSLMVCAVINGLSLPYSEQLIEMLKAALPGLTSVMLNINTEKTNVVLGKRNVLLWGEEWIEDELCGLKFRISPLSFYQVNRAQAERLYNKAAEYAELDGTQIVLDLYCGTGTIGLSMAKKAKKIIGVEVIPQAIENAVENAKINKIDNAEFICGDAGETAKMLEERGEKPHAVLLDPPRKGCSPDVIETVSKINPQKIVYISCDPATLARDLKLFSEKGFVPIEVTPFDLFPGTAHVEVCVKLQRG